MRLCNCIPCVFHLQCKLMQRKEKNIYNTT
nr:MAG TPA: hypothetical protein [Caudoviricetes sp.]